MEDKPADSRNQLAEVREFELPTGKLEIHIDHSLLPFDQLVRVGGRLNTKRGFVFVSPVLGKHIPAVPSDIRNVHRLLAEGIPDLPGPILFVGMAETAILLGHGVFDQFVDLTGRRDAVFIHTTRYRLSRPMILEFKEEHSHAADHYIYEPEDENTRNLVTQARSIVLIDDEASTGKTFHNLLAEIKQVLPSITRAVTVVITDWRGVKQSQSNADTMPLPSIPVAILHGRYAFTPAADLVSVQAPSAVGNGRHKDGHAKLHFGRLGIAAGAPFSSNRKIFEKVSRRLIQSKAVEGGHRLLILGTGEFAYPPFLLAEYLEGLGMNVRYQSTTRSPLMSGHAIAERLVFKDNYADDINNYLYNARRYDYDHIIICHETPHGSVDKDLCTALNAMTLAF